MSFSRGEASRVEQHQSLNGPDPDIPCKKFRFQSLVECLVQRFAEYFGVVCEKDEFIC